VPVARASSAPLPTEVSLARIISQGLIPATAAPDVVAAVSRQLAIQGQQVSAVPHALLVRAPAATPADAEAAFARGDLVRSWPMRGTVHITTAADHHWLRAALMHRTDAWVRRSEADYGVDTALCERAAEVALGLIEDQGPLMRSVLLAARQEAGPLGGPRPCRRRGGMGIVGRPASPSGPSSVSVNASCAREHFHSYVNPIGGGLGPFMRTLTHLVERGQCCPSATRWV